MRLQKVQKAPISPLLSFRIKVKMMANKWFYEYVDPLDTVHDPDKALVFFPCKLL
jgi:hypothetical protein